MQETVRDRDEVLIVDALGPVYANKVKRILTTDNGLYYSNGGAWVLISATPSVGKVDVRKNSAGSVFTRRRLNFIEGTNVTLTVSDDAGNDEVDITINASGGGTATAIGQVAISLDGSSLVAKLPVTDPAVGWLVDGTSGLMIVV
jgi:hypothetical protein